MAATALPSPLSKANSLLIKSIPVIAMANSLNKDPTEVARLISVGEKTGLFYLDLVGLGGDGFRESYEICQGVMKTWFDLSMDNKVAFALGCDIHG
jgi:hypothetical protein